jgi:hypothetical protein
MFKRPVCFDLALHGALQIRDGTPHDLATGRASPPASGTMDELRHNVLRMAGAAALANEAFTSAVQRLVGFVLLLEDASLPPEAMQVFASTRQFAFSQRVL